MTFCARGFPECENRNDNTSIKAGTLRSANHQIGKLATNGPCPVPLGIENLKWIVGIAFDPLKESREMRRPTISTWLLISHPMPHRDSGRQTGGGKTRQISTK